jgi:hypothetical protein
MFLSSESNACFVEALLPHAMTELPWKMRHTSRSDYYPIVAMEPPCHWVITRFGRLRTSLGIKPISETVAPAMREWDALLPVAQCTSEQARFIGLPESFEDLSEKLWQSAFNYVESTEDDALPGRFYSSIAHIKSPHGRIRCVVCGQYVARPEPGCSDIEWDWKYSRAAGCRNTFPSCSKTGEAAACPAVNNGVCSN